MTFSPKILKIQKSNQISLILDELNIYLYQKDFKKSFGMLNRQLEIIETNKDT